MAWGGLVAGRGSPVPPAAGAARLFQLTRAGEGGVAGAGWTLGCMVIALLPCPALIVIGIVVLVAVVLARGRRVCRQPGAFR
jgi:hypothetical protein